jgi:hypothetical protein
VSVHDKVINWRDWVDTHWGDVVALGILLLGVSLVVWGPQNTRAENLGEALVLAAIAALKLKTIPKNGNGEKNEPQPKP